MGISGSGNGHVLITPSDTANIRAQDGRLPRAVRFGVGGSCTIVDRTGVALAYQNIADGEVIECDILRINSTGLTGCDNIIGWY